MVTINGYAIDAVVSEDVSFDADVTEFPVESGASITDHVRVKPAVISLDGIVSDTPIGPIAALRDNPLFITPGLGGSLPSDEAYDALWRILNAAETITVATSKRVYDNMVLQSLAISHTATDGDSLRFKATFKQIAMVTTTRTIVAVAVPIAAEKENKGTKPPKYYTVEDYRNRIRALGSDSPDNTVAKDLVDSAASRYR